MVTILLLGAPGAGKGSQARLIEEEFGYKQISTGDLLRKEISDNTDLGMQVKGIIDKGELVSDDIIFEMLEHRIKESDCNKGIIFDGFPRNISQAERFPSLLGKKLDFVINIEVPFDVIIKRLSSRRQCTSCGAVYNAISNPTNVDDVCDKCYGHVIQRDDDKEETVKNRLEVYTKQTEPLIEYYKNKGNFYTFDGNRDIKVIFEEIKELLNK